jgi:hypothetical protein
MRVGEKVHLEAPLPVQPRPLQHVTCLNPVRTRPKMQRLAPVRLTLKPPISGCPAVSCPIAVQTFQESGASLPTDHVLMSEQSASH